MSEPKPVLEADKISFAGKWAFRFVEEGDADVFPAWVADNPQISRKDALECDKRRNPSNTFLIIERDGVPILFMPVYMVLRIGYLGFNPAAGSEERQQALEHMLRAVEAFALIYKIGTIDVLTKTGIPVAEWARAHGFEQDPRELFKLELFKRQTPEGQTS